MPESDSSSSQPSTAQPDTRSKLDINALANASDDGDAVLVKVLIKELMEAKTDVDTLSIRFNMALESAAFASCYTSNEERKILVEIIKMLIKAGADITYRGAYDSCPAIDIIRDEESKNELIAFAAKPHIVRQVSNFIMTGQIGGQDVQGKDDFIDKMAGAIQEFRQNCGIGGEGEGLGDNDKAAEKAAARKAAEVIYDGLERMSQRESIDNRTFMEFIEDLAQAALDFFTDLIFGEDKAATRSTVQEALRGNTASTWNEPGTSAGGDKEHSLHAQLKITMHKLENMEKVSQQNASEGPSTTTGEDNTPAATTTQARIEKVEDAAVTGTLDQGQSAGHQVS